MSIIKRWQWTQSDYINNKKVFTVHPETKNTDLQNIKTTYFTFLGS